MTKTLLVDDDHELVDLLAYALTRGGLTIVPASDAPTALALLETEQPDVAVLDVDLGSWNGFELLRDIRRQSDVPILMLTGLGAERDKLKGFELGADDYVTKPFSHRELLARLRALLKRRGKAVSSPAPAAALLQVGPLTLNVAEHTATKHGRSLNLTVTEFRVLHYLMSYASTVVPTRVLMKHVWGFDDPSGADTVRVALYRLRRKLEEDPAHPRLLHTISGVGVMLKPTLTEAPGLDEG